MSAVLPMVTVLINVQVLESDEFKLKAYFWDLSGQLVYRAMHSFSFGRFGQNLINETHASALQLQNVVKIRT